MVLDLSLEYEFSKIVADLISDPMVQSLKDMPQHSDGVSCFEHSIYVAFTSFVICKKLGLDSRAAARAGLLHDLHLCKLNGKITQRAKRLFCHPKMALENAKSKFELSEVECDIIEKHMWPLTLFSIPKYNESFVVNMVDTYCAIAEYLGIHEKAIEIAQKSELAFGFAPAPLPSTTPISVPMVAGS